MLREIYAEKAGIDFTRSLTIFLMCCEASGINNLNYTLLTSMSLTKDPKELIKGSREILKICKRVKGKRWQSKLENRGNVAILFSEAAKNISALLQKEAIFAQITDHCTSPEKKPWEKLRSLMDLVRDIGKIYVQSQ